MQKINKHLIIILIRFFRETIIQKIYLIMFKFQNIIIQKNFINAFIYKIKKYQ